MHASAGGRPNNHCPTLDLLMAGTTCNHPGDHLLPPPPPPTAAGGSVRSPSLFRWRARRRRAPFLLCLERTTNRRGGMAGNDSSTPLRSEWRSAAAQVSTLCGRRPPCMPRVKKNLKMRWMLSRRNMAGSGGGTSGKTLSNEVGPTKYTYTVAAAAAAAAAGWLHEERRARARSKGALNCALANSRRQRRRRRQ